MAVVLTRNLQLTAAEKAKSQKRNRELTGGSESARSQTKRVPFNGLNVNVVIINVNKIPQKDAKKASPPTNVTLFIRPFDQSITDGLDPLYYRWNATDNCIELAIQRHMDAEEARKVETQSDSYPDDPTKFRWVQLKPGSFITLADFKHESVAEDNLSLAKVFNLAPRMRKEKEKAPDDKEKEVRQDWGWHWFKVTPEKTKRLTLRALACLRDSFPQEAFFFEDQRFPQTSQSAVILSVVPQWDEATLVKTQRLGTYSFGSWFAIEDKPEFWAMTPTTANDKSVRLPNASPTDKSVWSLKAMRGLVMVEQSLNRHTQKVVVNFAIGANLIESNFFVKDLGVWYYVMRFVVPYLPFMAFCSINNLATKAALQNQDYEKAGKWHSPDEDTEMKTEVQNPYPTAGASAAPSEENPDGTANIDFRTMFKARQTQDKAMGGSEKVNVDADFAVIGYCTSLLMNAPQAYRSYLFPVPADWPLTPAPESGKDNLLQPYLRVDTNPEGKFESFDSLELGAPKDLGEVVCVTEYTAGNIDENIAMISKFVQLVKNGYGEWRVAVNSTEYRDPAKAQQIFYVACKATPAQGAQFLDKGSVTLDAGTPDEFAVSWTQVPFEKRRYALFYVNLTKGGDLEAEKTKAREVLSTSGITKSAKSASHAAPAAPPAAASAQRALLQITHATEKVSVGGTATPTKVPVMTAVAPQKGKVTEVQSDEDVVSQDAGDAAEERSSSSKSRKEKGTKKGTKKH